MHSNGHVRFGGRAGETGREQFRHCAPARPYFRIQRRTKQGTSKKYVYTYPSKKALAAIKDKVRAITHKSDPIPRIAL